MSVSRHVIQYAQGRAVRRIMRSMPWIGGVVALATLGASMRRKGIAGGALDTALDMTPFVGALKNGLEAVRGRDFVPDRAPSLAAPRRRT